jgi:hypothetical protein
MKKIFINLFLLALFFTAELCQAETKNWQIYQNPHCGYELLYPGNEKAVSMPELDARNYFDAFEPVNDLLANNPDFANTRLLKNCGISVALPILGPVGKVNLQKKQLFVFVLDNVPNTWPPSFKGPDWDGREINNGKLIKAGNHVFYQVRYADAGMSQTMYTDYYYLKSANKYYVLVFMLYSISTGVMDGVDTPYDPKLETADFPRILAKFKLVPILK